MIEQMKIVVDSNMDGTTYHCSECGEQVGCPWDKYLEHPETPFRISYCALAGL